MFSLKRLLERFLTKTLMILSTITLAPHLQMILPKPLLPG